MEFTQGSWARFGARSMVLSGAIAMGVFVGLKLANAGPGEPVRKALTVSGVLTGAPENAMATFRFYRAMGDSTPHCAPEVPIRDGMERDAATGAFSVEVPLDQTGHACPDTLFHDPSAYVEVAIGATVVVTRRPINPVPYAVYAQQYGAPDCPVGYERIVDATEGFPAESPRRLCRRLRADRTVSDQVVRVGIGPSAFWIDRYEAGIYASDGEANCETARGLPIDGQPRFLPSCTAWSRAGVMPSRANWFQANRACAASGKRLPSGPEWLLAAAGTDDPSETSDGADGRCVTDRSSSEGPRASGGRGGCTSSWGAEDMIGNVDEWTSEWFATVGNFSTRQPWVQSDGGTDWAHGDTVHNVNGVVQGSSDTGRVSGIPAGARRGGYWALGRQAGIFQLFLLSSPSDDGSGAAGFRCVIPR